MTVWQNGLLTIDTRSLNGEGDSWVNLSIDDFCEMDRVATGDRDGKLSVMIEILGGNHLRDTIRVINTE